MMAFLFLFLKYRKRCIFATWLCDYSLLRAIQFGTKSRVGFKLLEGFSEL